MGEGDTLTNAVIGAIVTAITAAFLPFSPVLGGALSGYLHGGTRKEALRVGTLSGIFALLPLLLIFFLVMTFFLAAFASAGGAASAEGALGFVFVLVGLVFAAAYVIGLSAAGGWLGHYIAQDTDVL